MLDAILRKGAIVPLEPLPTDWNEGVALKVDKADEPSIDVDAWAKTMNELCADSLVHDEEAMQRGIDAHRQQAKDQARRAMGLSA